MDSFLLRFFRISIIILCVHPIRTAPVNKNIGLVDRCLAKMGLQGKTMAKLKLEQLGELKGRIDAQYEACECRGQKYQLLLGLRREIAFLEGRYLWPMGFEKPKSRYEKWMTLLTSKDQSFTNSTRIMELRRRVFNEYKLSATSFVNNIIILYGEFSDDAAHRVKLPRNVDEKAIEGIFELISVHFGEHGNMLRTIRIILTPLKSIEPPETENLLQFMSTKTTNQQN